MKVRRANAVYLPDIVLPPGVVPTASLEEALHRADIVVAALPSHGTRAVIRSAAPFIPRQALIVSATKGIEQDTLLRVSEVIAQEVRGARPVAVLSGPSFAIEVARRLPTAVSVACVDPVLAEDVQREFRAAYFRLYGKHRRHRRRDRRRAEEHHRDCRRRRRRAWVWDRTRSRR